MTLPSCATIATVWPTLTHQRDYVANTRHKAAQCAKAHGNAYVRIGVTGSGQKPCYRVFYLTPDGEEKIFGSYWDNHSPLDNEHAINTNWSKASMSFAQLDALMLEKHGPGRLDAGRKTSAPRKQS